MSCTTNCQCKKIESEGGTGIRFRTFNINHTTNPDSPANNGKITVCTNDLGEGTLEVGMSFCSPKDNYMKPYGQFVAYGRMESERTRRVIKKWDDDLPVNDRLKMLALEVAGDMGKGKGIDWLQDVMSIDLV